MDRIDYRQVFREAYAPPRDGVARIVVPPRRCLALDGEGALGSAAFTRAAATVRALAKALRLTLKHGPMALDFRVMPLEVQWHGEARWTVLLFQPPVVDAALFTAAQASLTDAAAQGIALRQLPEAPALQTLHTGAMDQVQEALDRLQVFAHGHGLQLAGGHLAVDLGDPRKPPFSQNKTLIRRQLA